MKMKWIALAVCFALSPYCQACLNPEIKAVDDSPIKSVGIREDQSLDEQQRELLNTYLNKTSPPVSFHDWIALHNDRISAFLSVTHALERTAVPGTGEDPASALQMIEAVEEIRGDRLIARMDPTKIENWIRTGGSYVIEQSDGHVDKGHAVFIDHDARGGALHCGYDIQGFTNFQKVPHLHWNYNLKNHLADIHLDGIVSWIGGVIPNPNHLTYENSDVRHWLKKYLNKFGWPGFETPEMLLGSEL